MKKKLLGLCTVLCLFLALVFPVFAAEQEQPFDAQKIPYSTMMSDGAGLLTPVEAEKLNARAWQLTREYRCAVYMVTVPSLGGMGVEEAADYLLQEYHLGYGSDQSCVLLLLSTEYRDYDIMAYGYGNTAFTDYGKEKMAERFLDEFGADDWYGGFTEYLDCCEEYLELARKGKPFDVGSDRSPFVGLAIGILVPLLVAFTVCSIFKAQMKTAKMQQAAQEYIDGQGLVLTVQNDRFLHTTRSKRYIEPAKSSGGTTASNTAPITTQGVYQRANFVIKFSAWAFLLLAFSTRSKIFATVDSPNTLVTRTRSRPLRFTHPLITSSPGCTSRGSDSPVSAAVSTVELPSKTTPSRGIFSPALTTITWPMATWSGSTCTSSPSCSIFA